MSRTIKFRAWDGENMHYQDEIYFLFGRWNSDKNNEAGFWAAYRIGEDDIPDFEAEENTSLMQFTGLLDKNGKEVYEGDVVVWKNLDTEVYYDIYYNEQDICWFARQLNDIGETESYLDNMYMEVIGNIHENSNLIT